MIKILMSILLETKKEALRKSVKHVDTHGGFPKIPKNNQTKDAMNAHLASILKNARTVAWEMVAMDVRGRRSMMTIITIKIRCQSKSRHIIWPRLRCVTVKFICFFRL